LFSYAASRSSLSESDAAKAQETANLLHPGANMRIRKTFPPSEVFGQCRAVLPRQVPKDDRRPSENLVSKQEDKMEVIFIILLTIKAKFVWWKF